MPAITYHIAGEGDESSIASILRATVMEGWVRLQLLRTPSYFAADALFGEAVTLLARQGDEAIGLCRAQNLPVWINGTATQVWYLAGLRVLPRFRHKISILRGGFAALRTLVLTKYRQAPFCFTSIASDNTTALRLLEADLPDMPSYRPLSRLCTLAFSSRQGRSGSILRQARQSDIPALATFHQTQAAAWQFTPHLKASWLMGLSKAQALSVEDFFLHEEQGKIRACVALWDQRQLKQIVAAGYRTPLNFLRIPCNCLAHLGGRISLPPPGEALNQAYLAFFASNMDITTSIALVREALWLLRKRGIAVGMLGLAAATPLRQAVQQALSATAYETCIETVRFDGDPDIPLDTRLPQPEIALL